MRRTLREGDSLIEVLGRDETGQSPQSFRVNPAVIERVEDIQHPLGNMSDVSKGFGLLAMLPNGEDRVELHIG